MWDIRRRLELHRLPAGRLVVRFDFLNVPRQQHGRRTSWLVLSPPDVDLCLKDCRSRTPFISAGPGKLEGEGAGCAVGSVESAL